MYAPEQYVEAPPTVEALCFIVQQYLRMRGSSRPDNYQMAPPQQQQPPQPNQQPNLPAAIPPPPAQPAQPPPHQQPAPYRQQPQRAVFQLRRPITFRDRLPAERSRTKTGVTTSNILPYKPIRRMDLSITTTRNKQPVLPSIITNTGNRCLLYQLWLHRTFGI